MPTYTQIPNSIRGLAGLSGLYSRHRQRVVRNLPELVAETQQAARTIEEMLGVPFRGLSVLDVGPGQFLIQSHVLAVNNDVTAMDLEAIVTGFSPINYVRMLRSNGPVRTLKTVARKALGIDREYRRQLEVNLGVRPLPKVKLIQGNVMGCALPDGRFQAVHCRALFEHLDEPETAIRELARVLAPGGVLFISVHLYTSYNGSLDPRVSYGTGDESLHWAHLRAAKKDTMRSEAHRNQFSLAEWNGLFSRVCPGCKLEIENSERAGIREVAEKLVHCGEIQGYGVDELCAHTLRAFWKKPAKQSAVLAAKAAGSGT